MIHFTSFVFSVKFVSGEILCSPLSFQCESVFFCALRGKIGTWIGTHILEASFKKSKNFSKTFHFFCWGGLNICENRFKIHETK